MLLGRVLEAASGKALSDAFMEYVIKPMSLESTTIGLPEGARGTAAATENCSWRGRLIQGEVHDENAVVLGKFAGHTGVFSTAKDLGSVCRAMLNEGSVDGKPFLSPRTIERMTTGHTDTLNLRRGLAWQGRDLNSSPGGDLASERSYGHTGFTGTSIWIDPELDAYVVLLTNAVHSDRDQARISTFRRRLHNKALALVSRGSGAHTVHTETAARERDLNGSMGLPS